MDNVIRLLGYIQKANLQKSNISLDFIIQRNQGIINWMNLSEVLKSNFEKTSSDPEKTTEYYQSISNKYLSEGITEYQDPHEYVVLRQLEEGLRNSLEEYGYKIPERPIIGSVYTPEVNAHVYRFKGIEQKIILFRAGILKYYSFYLRTLMPLMKWEETEDGENLNCIADQNFAIEVVESNPDVLKGFYQVIRSTILNRFSEELTKEKDYKYYEDYMFYHFARLRASLWSFIVGHEYGHILNGDLDDNKNMNPDDYTVGGEKITLSHLQEHLADLKGFEIMNREMVEVRGASFLHTMVSTCLFFAGIDLLYRTIGDVLEVEYPSSWTTHPDPIKRWKVIQGQVYENSEDKDYSKYAIQIASNFADIVEVVYGFNGELVTSLKPYKNEIAQIWLRE